MPAYPTFAYTTIIRSKWFHFWVRNGIRWVPNR